MTCRTKPAPARLHLAAALALLAAVACGDPNDIARGQSLLPEKPEAPVPLVDLVVDANRSGRLDPGAADEDEGENDFTAASGAIFLANIDDDDGDGVRDADNLVVDGDDDVRDLAPLLVRAWPEAPEGTTGLLVLGHPDQVRLFSVDGPEDVASSYEHVPEAAALALSTEELRGGVRFAIEGLGFASSTAAGAWDGSARFTLEVKDAEGTLLGSDEASLRVAPLLFQYNTAPTETVFYTSGGAINRQFARGVEAAADAALVPVVGLQLPGGFRDWDQWTQDFFDIGHTAMPGPDGTEIGMQVAVRSAQPDRPAGGIVDSHFAGSDWGTVFLHAANWTAETHGYSMNSFGNWEVVPPFGDFPLGRNVWGAGTRASAQPDPVFVDFVRAQRVQPDIVVDTSWLVVGHVDEVFSWVQADSDRGWRMLVGAPALARSMLLDLQAGGEGGAVLFAGRKWVDYFAEREVPADATVDEILGDDDLMAATQAAQIHTDEMFAILQAELALDPDEITPMPFVYEDLMGGLVSHQPGTVNLLHVDGKVVIPEPFGPVVDGVDVFRVDLEERLGALGLDVFFTDNWDVYHRNLGEVHCGTNVARRMSDLRWWESGR